MKYILPFLLLLISCQKYGLSLRSQRIDATYLASTHVGSPDPRQERPPCGQMVVIEWWVPKALLSQEPRICLTLLFWDFTTRTVVFPIQHRIGSESYFVIGEDFETTCGLISYKADIVTGDGTVFRDWKHQLWTELIEVSDESSSSVSSQERQGSVSDAPSPLSTIIPKM